MLNVLLEPLKFEFMRNALFTAIMLGVLCSVVGSYLIVQRMGLLLRCDCPCCVTREQRSPFSWVSRFFLVLLSGGTLSTFFIAWIQSQSRIKVDVAMALVFSGFLALGIILITLLKSKLDLHSFLFGDILGVTPSDV